MDEIKNKVRNYLKRSVKNSAFDDETDIFKLGIVHSLFAMQLVIFIEKEFGVEVCDADLDMEHFHTVNKIAELISTCIERNVKC